ERLRSLVVGASTGSIEDKEMVAARDAIRMPGFDNLPADFREVGPSYRIEHPDGVARWIAIEQRAQQRGAAAQPMRSPQTLAKIERIATPALVIAGGADLIAPPGLMRGWSRHLPNAEFVTIADAGHALAWERAEEFSQRVLEFLRRH